MRDSLPVAEFIVRVLLETGSFAPEVNAAKELIQARAEELIKKKCSSEVAERIAKTEWLLRCLDQFQKE